MSISSWNGGIIRPVAVAPTGPYSDGAAPGIWTLDQQAFWLKQGLWPIAGNVNPANLGFVFGGGIGGPGFTAINSFSFSSLAALTFFGNLTAGLISPIGVSSNTRGVMGGGYTYIDETVGITNVLNYITIATAGNATSFGALTQARYQAAGTSNQTRGLCAGGLTSSPTSIIDYITIATTGNATSFGNLTTNNDSEAACASPTRALFAGGQISPSSFTSQIRFNTIASTGNSTNFGTLYTSVRLPGGCSSNTRGVFAGGITFSTSETVINIGYVTIDTTGNTTNFGDLQIAAYFDTATSNSITGVFLVGGGSQRVTIATLGNATTFSGISGFSSFGSLSGGHGGL
jgi:hypothetical protein